MALNARKAAKQAARISMQLEPTYQGCVIHFCELLDDDPRYSALTYNTVVGAVRAAARQLGRYDAAADEVTAA